MDEPLNYPLFLDLPMLTKDDLEDAAFRGRDRAWAELCALFDEMSENDSSVSYTALGDRIGRSRAQVQRWLYSPHNMTLQSLSLLVEGLDADLTINVKRRLVDILDNSCHPADSAKADVDFQVWAKRQKDTSQNRRNSGSMTWEAENV